MSDRSMKNRLDGGPFALRRPGPEPPALGAASQLNPCHNDDLSPPVGPQGRNGEQQLRWRECAAAEAVVLFQQGRKPVRTCPVGWGAPGRRQA
mmetsp:Transcript_13678/g.30650  ORF Transcript_13678/g.30650 Transcript_13678/m.30650 type:complete len:93 (-) Transcript_13678:239-517(-)